MVHWWWLLILIIITLIFMIGSYMFGYHDGLEHGKMERHNIQ